MQNISFNHYHDSNYTLESTKWIYFLARIAMNLINPISNVLNLTPKQFDDL